MQYFDFIAYTDVDICRNDDLTEKVFELWQGDVTPAGSNGQNMLMSTLEGHTYEDAVETFERVFAEHFPYIEILRIDPDSF